MNAEQLRQNAAAIICIANREPVQYFHGPDGKWIDAADDDQIPNDIHKRPYRPKPKPVIHPWSKPEDVPNGGCWMRRKDSPSVCWLVVSINPSGVFLAADSQITGWEEIGRDLEYSTNRQTWHTCTITEEAP